MALNEQQIATDIADAFIQVMNDESDDRMGAINKVARTLAQAMIAAIQSATINYSGGLSAPNGPVSGTFNGNLS